MNSNQKLKLNLDELITAWETSSYPSIKTTSYFPVYAKLFGHLRNTSCTFIETGILEGGSLFMWRKWLGDDARIIGVDLNPDAKKWEKFGFEIFIGDQACLDFWDNTFLAIGGFDVFLDDGGHQSFQQIVSVEKAIESNTKESLVVVEDTYTSFMNDFQSHKNHSFLEFSKDATDLLVGRSFEMYPGRFPAQVNLKKVTSFQNVFSINFYNGIVAFHIAPEFCLDSRIIRNQPPNKIKDFRYEGINNALISWPNLLKEEMVQVDGGA